jgi:hypothetical protein
MINNKNDINSSVLLRGAPNYIRTDLLSLPLVWQHSDYQAAIARQSCGSPQCHPSLARQPSLLFWQPRCLLAWRPGGYHSVFPLGPPPRSGASYEELVGPCSSALARRPLLVSTCSSALARRPLPCLTAGRLPQHLCRTGVHRTSVLLVPWVGTFPSPLG